MANPPTARQPATHELSFGWEASFGPFRIVPTRRQLFLGDRLVRLGGRAFDVLQALVENPGQFVDKRYLFDHVWPNLVVDETSLRSAVAAVRRALREDRTERVYVETVRGYGYRLAGEVSIELRRPLLAAFVVPPELAADVNFGPFRLSRTQRRLYYADRSVELGEPSYAVLEVLVLHAGDTIDKWALIRSVWGSLNVDESNLRVAIAALRRAMRRAGREREYITTVPRRGYRFVEPVTTDARSKSCSPAGGCGVFSGLQRVVELADLGVPEVKSSQCG